MHGEQGTFFFTILKQGCCQGQVCKAIVGPKIATVGMPKAPAICIGPESLVMNRDSPAMLARSSPIVVFPAKSW